jgi:hypothetical protein
MVGEDLTFDAALAEAQRRGLRPISGGDGEAAPPNPWAQYGLGADGKPLDKPADEKPDATAAELADVKTKLAAAEAKLAKLPGDFDGLNKKLAVIDRLTKALGGDTVDPGDPKTKEVWDDLKSVAKQTAPGVHKLLEMLERDPHALDRVTQGVDALAGSRLEDLNLRAHERVMARAAKVFKGYTQDEIEKAVLPYEETMTQWINKDAKLQRAYVTGDLRVVDSLFDELHKPHVAARTREKQARLAPTGLPKAPPKGGGAGAGEGDEKPKPRDFSPAGKRDFMKGAVGRWLDKGRNKDDDA